MFFQLQTLCKGILLCVVIPSVFSQFTDDQLTFDAGELGKLKGAAARTYKLQRPFIQFLGIPYVEPPTNEARFLPAQKVNLPLSPTDVNGSFVATRYGSCCPQAATNIACLIKLNEDCLKLNIFTPLAQNSMEKLLPVIVFIHGGSFTGGSADMYNAYRLLDRDVVYVNFNYRLGVLGFFCLNTNDAPGNAAMYDIVEALRFIKAHIRHFGGDPDKITLTGQSAGSAAVTHLMVSPMIRGEELFHRAIALSGTALNEWATGSHEDAEKASLKVAELSGCYNPADEYIPADVVNCMKSAAFGVLVSKLTEYQNEENRLGRLGLGPVKPVVQIAGAEPRFLTEWPEAIMDRGEQADIPLIMGTTQHDGSFVLGTEYNKFIKVNGYEADPVFLRTKLVPTLLQALGIQDPTGAIFDALANLYLGKEAKNSGNFTLMIPGLTDLHSVFFFKAAGHRTLLLHSRLQSQSYWYNFAYAGRFSVYSTLVSTRDNPVKGGVGHGDDLVYLFNLPLMGNLPDEDHAVSNRLIDYWVNFASTGNPNLPASESSQLHEGQWPAYSEDQPYFAEIKGQDEFILGIPNDYWLGVTDELYPEFQDSTTTTTTAEPRTTDEEDENTSEGGGNSTPTENPVDETTPDSSLPTTSVSLLLTISAILLSYSNF